MRLVLFDLDGTVLSGDSDTLWCRFLIDQGVLAPGFQELCDEMAVRYAEGTVVPGDYYGLHAGTVEGYRPSDLLPMREAFLRDVIRPRISGDARALLQRHRDAGETLVLTTATHRVVSELTAADLQVDHYLCTELEQADGRYTGRIAGVANMRSGKVDRLRSWIRELGHPDRVLKEATFYSDSINDLALLSAVGRPIVVDPDPRLESTALRKGWSVLRLDRGRAARESGFMTIDAKRRGI